MTDPGLALQSALVAALAADSGVGALVGDRIYDAPPRNATFPYLTFGDARILDWSTATEAGAEHRLILDVWSRERGRRQCYEIVRAVNAVLDEAALSLDDHVLINLRFEAADLRREADGITYHALMRFRAVTEPG